MKKSTIQIIIILLSVSLNAQITFVESSAAQNINVSFGDHQFNGGISFFDFDNDGWDDLTYASEQGEPVYFFKNMSGTFQQVTFNYTDTLDDTRQVIWVDIDNDDDNDLFIVSNDASNRLLLNDGSFNFQDITSPSGISTATMGSWGASWGDYNNDGYLDLFLCNRDIMNGVQPNILYKNNGNNTFTNVNTVAGIDNGNHYSFCASFFDYNNDGFQDIYIANDRFTTTNILYKNNGNGTFTDVSVTSGTGMNIDAMSTTIDDYDNDGFQDIYITNTSAGNYFLKNNGDGTFTNIATATGTTFNSVAWGAVFLDADNDTDVDLYVSGMRDGSDGSLPSAFYENQGDGTFVIPSAAGFASDTAESYSNAIGDINNDGFPDMTVINRTPIPNFLWTNTSTSGYNWIKIKLEGVQSNKMGVGSKIELFANGKRQYQYVICGEGYISQNSGLEFFGLRNATTIDYIKVTWLSGLVDVINNVTVNQTLTIVEGSAPLSITENELGKALTVYPNPSEGQFTIDIPNLENNSAISIYTTHGQKVYSGNLINNSVQLDGLSQGVYFLNITIQEKTYIKKIIIK